MVCRLRPRRLESASRRWRHECPLRHVWLQRAMHWQLERRLGQCEKPLLSEEEEAGILRADLCSFLSDNGLSCSAAVAPGQPFALELLRGMLSLFADVDVDPFFWSRASYQGFGKVFHRQVCGVQ